MKPPKKIAVIGAVGYQRLSKDHRVDCFRWDKLDSINNLRDYDTVLLNVLALQNPGSLRSVNWDTFRRVLNPSTMRDIVGGGSIIVLGDPRFNITFNSATKPLTEYNAEPFLAWTGINFYWDNQPGDTILFSDDYDHRHFKEYIKHLKRWDYSLRSCELNVEAFSKLYNLGKDSVFVARLNTDLFCQNRYGGVLAFTSTVSIERKGTYSYGSEVVLQLGSVVFLPRTELTEDEAIVVVLRDLCGMESPLPEPAWISGYVAPGQDAIDNETREIEQRIDALLENHKTATSKRASARLCLQLLYERGTALEIAVRETLRKLGANVEDPDIIGKEDGWISITSQGETFEGVLEVKGTNNSQFTETGIRQLLDWVHRGVETRQKKCKGVFIGNSSATTHPDDRPYSFAENWRKSSQLHGLVALTSMDLYLLYLLNANGKLDLDRFWVDLFTTNGIFDIGPYLTEPS